MDTEIKGVVTDLSKEINRQLWGCGYGMLGKWTSGTSTTIVVPKSYRGATNSDEGAFGDGFGAKYFKEINSGVLVRITSVSTNVVQTTSVDTVDMAVSAISEGTTTDSMTVSDPGTPAAGTYFVRPGATRATTGAEAGDYPRLEMMGLRGIVTDTNMDGIVYQDGSTLTNETASHVDVDSLQALPVGTYTWWKALVDTHTSGRYHGQRSLTLNLMQKMFDKVEVSAGKDYGPDVIMTTHAIRREYLELMQADRRNVNTMSLDGGWTALDYNGVPLMVDVDAIDGEIYFLTTKDLAIYRMSDYEWMSKDGSVLSRMSAKDAYEATIFRYAELGCKRRNSQGVLCDLSYSL